MSADADATILDLYARELSYLRERGADFAAAYPKVASRLGVADRQCSDPHVERLIESFAFLTARLQRQLDQDLPELTAGLLGVLYPQYTSPIPSMAIAGFTVDVKEAALTSGYTIEKGTLLFAEAKAGPTCWFRTCYPVTLWPIVIESAAFVPWEDLGLSDSVLPVSDDGVSRRPAGAIRVRLTSGPELRALGVKRLRFYLNGDPIESARMYDLLFERDRPVLVTGVDADRSFSRGRLAPVGFAEGEDVIPCPPHALPGHRLAQEYFAFPRKFMFFDVDLDGLPAGQKADLLILLDRRPGNVAIRKDTFRLSCTPVVNLFPRTTEPVRVDGHRAEYRLVGDARRERHTEIHSVQAVTATGPGEPVQQRYAPFFSFAHPEPGDGEPRVFWHARRSDTGRADLPGSDLFLSFVDLDFNARAPGSEVVYAQVLCTNRGLTEQVDTGTPLMLELAAPTARAECLTKPTPQIAAPAGGQTLWRLVSNLSLNHLSLGGAHGAEALREILRAYLFSPARQAEQQISAITELESATVSRRLGAGAASRGMCRGTEVTLKLAEDQFGDSSPILFAEVLNRFLGLYAHLNSFTQLVLRSTAREEVWKRWPPMAGAKTLL